MLLFWLLLVFAVGFVLGVAASKSAVGPLTTENAELEARCNDIKLGLDQALAAKRKAEEDARLAKAQVERLHFSATSYEAALGRIQQVAAEARAVVVCTPE